MEKASVYAGFRTCPEGQEQTLLPAILDPGDKYKIARVYAGFQLFLTLWKSQVGVAPQASRLLAFRKAGKDTVKSTARTRQRIESASVSSPPKARFDSGAPTADARDRLDQARHKPPPQGANRQRRHSAGAWPHGPCRPLAFGKGGGLHPRHAGFLRSARPERSQRN